jgi:hypothetical protein
MAVVIAAFLKTVNFMVDYFAPTASYVPVNAPLSAFAEWFPLHSNEPY